MNHVADKDKESSKDSRLTERLHKKKSANDLYTGSTLNQNSSKSNLQSKIKQGIDKQEKNLIKQSGEASSRKKDYLEL